jgi:hypothetical protein
MIGEVDPQLALNADPQPTGLCPIGESSLEARYNARFNQSWEQVNNAAGRRPHR